MSLPAILSITIVGVPYLILSLQYYRRKIPEKSNQKVETADDKQNQEYNEKLSNLNLELKNTQPQNPPGKQIEKTPSQDLQGLNLVNENENLNKEESVQEIQVQSSQSLGKSALNDQTKFNTEKKGGNEDQQHTTNQSLKRIASGQTQQGKGDYQLVGTQNPQNKQENRQEQFGQTPQGPTELNKKGIVQQSDHLPEEQIVKDIGFQKYKRWQNIFLVISSIIFFQSIISRVYVKNTKKIIEVPEFFVLSAINALCVIFLYNCIYSGILELLERYNKSSQMIAKFFFVFYGLSMTFPIYAGLDDFIKLDFITSIIGIIYSVIIQYGIMKIKQLENWPTYIDFNIIK